jgi:NitT/TauT family transport system ATP-binding protein
MMMMQDLLVKVVADYRTAALLVTHDIDEALQVSDRIILLGGSPAGRPRSWHAS